MEKSTYVIGHRSPETGSVCSAIAYTHLKNCLGHPTVRPARAGEIDAETTFVLSYADHIAPGEQAGEEIQVPREFRQQRRHRQHAGEQTALAPQGDHRGKERDIGRPQKMRRAIMHPVYRRQHGDEQGAGNLDPERDH
jgi:hypothetical protein